MTQLTRKHVMLKYFLMVIMVLSASANSFADELSGTWKFEKSKEYFGAVKNVPSPKYLFAQIVNGKLSLSQKCYTDLKQIPYNFSDIYQSLVKQDVSEKAVDQFLTKNFAFVAQKKTSYSISDYDEKCLAPFFDIVVTDNELVTVYGGAVFYSYTRTSGGTNKPLPSNVTLYGHKLSQLPFSMSNFMNLCEASIPSLKGVKQSTDKCAPVYYPYSATKKDTDALTQLIGSHDYKKGGARNAEDYDNPLANNLHPTFMILPPLKDVLVVRVDDFEPGIKEQRDMMSGAYLSIKDGKVIDQLNFGCTIDPDYYCVAEDGTKQYQLVDTGKFKKLN